MVQMHDKEVLKDLKTEGNILRHPAKTFDFFTVSRYRGMKTVGVLPPRQGDRILDVGCGTGELACLIKQLAGEQGRVAGIDPSANMIKVARHKAEKLKLDIDFRLAAIEQLPFEDAAFDEVYSTLMTHHLPAAIKKQGFKEVRRVLRQDGKFLIFDIGEPSNLLIRLMALPFLFLERHAFSDNGAVDSNIRGEVPELLRQAGFSNVRRLPRDSLLLFGLLEYIIAE